MRPALQIAVFAVLAVSAGISFVVQGGVNARLRGALGSPNWAALASYAGGTLVMAIVVLAARDPLPSLAAFARSPWWAWLGGLFGAVYVIIIILLLPRLGAAALLALFVLGQMLASLAFDQVGAFGVPRHPVDALRIAGVLMLVGGVVLIRR